jgi:hypothetical protein
MTEAEWIECTDGNRMLRFLLQHPTGRKWRLFQCAWCRYVLADTLTYEPLLAAVETAERYTDRLVADDERQMVWEKMEKMAEEAMAEQDFERASVAADARDCVAVGSQQIVGLERKSPFQRPQYQCHLLRDIFGNPFRPVTVEQDWLASKDGLVPRLAKAIYDERAFEQMPELANALEEAGCNNEDLLGHCRQPGQHVRGCWVVDLLLGYK